MIQKRFYSFTIIALVLFFILNCQLCQAGIFSDIKLYFNERAAIKAHSNNVISQVKDIYKSKNSIHNFIESATRLKYAYSSIKNKKLDILGVINIAKSIDSLVREYQFLAPKAEKFYKNIQPDLNYFAKLDGGSDIQSLSPEQKQKILLQTFSDSRIEKLSASVGWGRVFGAVKDNPLNIFRWGRLTSEYKYGKTEGIYALKTAQIGFEATAYYLAGKNAMQDILKIRQEINGIVSGDWKAILNMGQTMNNIQGAGSSIDRLSTLVTTAGTHFTKRINEFNARQNDYLAARQAYLSKYGTDDEKASIVKTASTATSNVITTTNSSSSNSTSFNVPTESRDIQAAMAAYQKAYQNYTAIVQNPKVSEQQKLQAIENLRAARTNYESLKAAYSR